MSEESKVAPQQDLVEAVKRHILNMLHLQNRPNVTRPVPRSTLLQTLRKLHVGHVAADGSMQISGSKEELRQWGGQRQGGSTREAPGPGGAGDKIEVQETSEIITFAEAGK